MRHEISFSRSSVLGVSACCFMSMLVTRAYFGGSPGTANSAKLHVTWRGRDEVFKHSIFASNRRLLDQRFLPWRRRSHRREIRVCHDLLSSPADHVSNGMTMQNTSSGAHTGFVDGGAQI